MKGIPELGWIVDKKLRRATEQVLQKHPYFFTLPASPSGKFHDGNTVVEHTRKAVKVMQCICREFDIKGWRRDSLLVAIILHDIGKCLCAEPGRTDKPGWKYYPATDWSVRKDDMYNHPEFSYQIVQEYFTEPLGRETAEYIGDMVKLHMSHWNENIHLPVSEDEKYVALADYLASQSDIKIIIEKLEEE